METTENVVKPRSRFTSFLISFTFILAVLLTLAAIYFWFASQSLTRHVQHLRTQTTQQQRTLTSVQATLQDLTQPQAKRARALNEAEYLVNLANLNLDFEGNVSLVINLLKTADQQLAALNDPTLMRVRQALAYDITQLEAAPKLDLPGLILKINAISQQIPQLPVMPNELSKPTTTTTSPDTTTAELPAWRKAMSAVGQALTNVVVVRRLNQPIAPLLSPEQRIFSVLNIQLELGQAKWAALHQQPEIYKESLQQAINWTKQYFLQKDSITQSVLQQLTELQKINIKPVLPSIASSLNAIQEALNTSVIKNSTVPVTSPIS